MSDKQLYYGDDHKTIGPAEPPDTPFDIDEMREELSYGCPHKLDSVCSIDPDDFSEFCICKDSCPMEKW